MDKWQTRRILILGTTYPNHSKTYIETVCTGGIFEDTREMCRLYPIPVRYLEAESRFRAFQMIRARVKPDSEDPRPESYKIDAKSIEPMEIIPPKQHELRRSFLDRSPHFCKSLEELIERQESTKQSLGIIIPKSIIDCSVEMKSEKEREEWMALEAARQQQERLFGEKPKPLDFPEAKFLVQWQCDDTRCMGHKMGLHQWGIHELYRKYRNQPDGREKVIQAMQRRLDESGNDIYLFLGNFRGRMYNFGLMDSYSAPARERGDREGFSLFKDQPVLFS
jgi:hypothetical protein